MVKKENQKGFTLVEVIVVAVIVAVLAAVAVPLYNGYIRDSRTNVCQNLAGTIASACAATIQQDLTVPEGLDGATNEVVEFPSVNGTTNNNIRIPKDYTVADDGANITVTGPGDATSTAVAYTVASGS